MRKRLEILFVLMLFSATAMLAQMTTSGINGMVTAGGDKAIGATVTAVHEPSGTTYNTVVNESGRYSINGMRVGGPYTESELHRLHNERYKRCDAAVGRVIQPERKAR